MKFVIRLVALTMIAATLTVGPRAATAQETEPPPEEPPAEAIYPMYFPVVGGLEWTDTFGAPRGSDRTHAGNDLMAPKMTEVIAVADGTVGWMHNEQGGNCCDMALRHDDGWESWYIHLNNDTEGTDDGLGWGFAPGIEPGVHVVAGQLIGYVGDSGNAEAAGSHLHFELHDPDGTVVNPYPHLVAATVLDAPLPNGYSGEFWDDEGSVHEANIDALAALGVTAGCEENMYCPSDTVTRGQMATFIVRALGWETGNAPDAFTDDDGTTHEANINELAARGVTGGCGEGLYCAGEPVTRAQMGTFLVRAFQLTVDGAANPFSDIGGSTHEDNIVILAAVGVTTGCEDGMYCPANEVTRAQMATFLIRALSLLEA
jgi:hypothetical protein